MDKKIVLLIMATTFFVFTGTAMAQLSTTTRQNIESLTDSLTEDAKNLAKEKIEDAMDGATQVIGNEVSEVTQSIIKKIPSKVLDILQAISSTTINFVRGSINDDMREWFARRKIAVMEGLREEKEEFGGNIKEILYNIWEKIKDVFKKNTEEITEELKE